MCDRLCIFVYIFVATVTMVAVVTGVGVMTIQYICVKGIEVIDH